MQQSFATVVDRMRLKWDVTVKGEKPIESLTQAERRERLRVVDEGA